MSFNINIKILSFLCATFYVSVEREEWKKITMESNALFFLIYIYF
jgi:hypothetical protein